MLMSVQRILDATMGIQLECLSDILGGQGSIFSLPTLFMPPERMTKADFHLTTSNDNIMARG